MVKYNVVLAMLVALFVSGCTYKVSTTSELVKIDGTKVDFSKLDELVKIEQCYNAGKGGSASVMTAIKQSEIKYVVHVDYSRKGTEICAIVYGKKEK